MKDFDNNEKEAILKVLQITKKVFNNYLKAETDQHKFSLVYSALINLVANFIYINLNEKDHNAMILDFSKNVKKMLNLQLQGEE